MTSNYTLSIAGCDSLYRGVYKSCIAKGWIDLTISKNDKTLTQASLATDRTSFERTIETTKAKINLICNRLGIQESELNYDREPLPRFSTSIYKLRFLKNIAFEVLIPVQWIIVYKKKDQSKWKKIIPDSSLFQADPFIVLKDNTNYVFYEELKFEEWHGYLRAAELDIENNQLINDQIILDLDFHLSFPNVFEEDGTFYMIPESGDSRSVDLFECTSFPYKWHKKRTLIDNIQAVDTTPLKQDGHWYLFTSEIVDGASCDDELSIYKSDDLLNSPFEKLYDNPIMTDVLNARMAGHFIQKDNEIYRVSQNCGKRYGHQVNINRVIQIENGYQEELVDTIKPSKGALGFHTYNQAGDVIIGDMEIARFDWVSLRRFVGGTIKRIFEIVLRK